MCGIAAIFGISPTSTSHAELRRKALLMAKAIRHRGPDWSGVYADDRAIVCHERLSIVGVDDGAQPLKDVTTGSVLGVNGEIYNHVKLQQEKLRQPSAHKFQTKSDCEVVMYLYEESPQDPRDFLCAINGIFAFVLWDPKRDTFLLARDPIGVCSMYVGWDADDHMYVSSEMKGLVDHCSRIEEFPPGHFYLGHEASKGYQRYYAPQWMTPGYAPSESYDAVKLRTALEDAVHRQLMCDVPYGVLISGGVDSSVIASIAAKYAAKRIETADTAQAWWPRLHSFAVGVEGAPDFAPARRVADHIGSVHHEITFTIQEGLDALSDVIQQIETFDVTTIRASTPMYLLMRKIKAMGIKMILSGEGADELFGGYLYFHKAPNPQELHEELLRKIDRLHLYDCARANKAAMGWGVEARVPFLDVEFLETAMMLDPAVKMPKNAQHPTAIEKWPLRKAFEGYVPDDVLFRQKEQFSDGVGYGWIDALKDTAEAQVSDAQLAGAASRFPFKTPTTKEAYMYRQIFAKHFPSETAAGCVPWETSVACSTSAALKWDAAFAGAADPSGRAVKGVHVDAVEN